MASAVEGGLQKFRAVGMAELVEEFHSPGNLSQCDHEVDPEVGLFTTGETERGSQQTRACLRLERVESARINLSMDDVQIEGGEQIVTGIVWTTGFEHQASHILFRVRLMVGGQGRIELAALFELSRVVELVRGVGVGHGRVGQVAFEWVVALNLHGRIGRRLGLA
jgi:hypothetical protein